MNKASNFVTVNHRPEIWLTVIPEGFPVAEQGPDKNLYIISVP